MTKEAEKRQAAEALFDKALPRIESTSIREWAQGQRDTWIRLDIIPIIDKHGPDCVDRVVVAIISEAIGL